MKVVLYANSDWYLYNFRRTLIERLLARGEDVLLLSPDGPYGPRLAALGVRWTPLAMDRRSLNPFAELKLIADLVGLLAREKPDLIHGFTIKGAVYGGLAARLAGVRRRVLAVAGLGFVFSNTSPKARLLRPVVRLVMRLAFGGAGARLIVQNREDAEFFRRSGLIASDRIRLIPGSGVDCSRFAPIARAAKSDRRAILPARLLRDKGIEAFVEAARRLRGKGHPLTFVLAGAADPGNPNSVTEAELAAWTEEGVIDHQGHVDDMAALLGRCEMVVLPTRYGEGVPRSLVEAGACGLPVVASDIAGCRELIDHEVNGLLFRAGDQEALTAAVERLFLDENLARRLGENARQRVLNDFSDEVVLAKTLAVYEELATGSAPPLTPTDGPKTAG